MVDAVVRLHQDMIPDDVYHLIEMAGGDILNSDVFRRVAGQRHHIFSTVGYHSIHVARVMMIFSLFFSMDTRRVIRACLWHDVGIYNRKSFSHNMGTEHPKRSLDIADRYDELDDTQKDMIGHHMWPMCAHRPETKEGFLITVADKWCAVTEFLGIRHRRIVRLINREYSIS